MENNDKIITSIQDAKKFLDSLTVSGVVAATRLATVWQELDCAEKLCGSSGAAKEIAEKSRKETEEK